MREASLTATAPRAPASKVKARCLKPWLTSSPSLWPDLWIISATTTPAIAPSASGGDGGHLDDGYQDCGDRSYGHCEGGDPDISPYYGFYNQGQSHDGIYEALRDLLLWMLVPVVRGNKSLLGGRSSPLVKAFSICNPPFLTMRRKIVKITKDVAGCFNTWCRTALLGRSHSWSFRPSDIIHLFPFSCSALHKKQ